MIVGNEEVATPRGLTKTSNSKGITHPESRSSGQDQCNGSSSLPPVSEIKNASRSQRIQLSSESGSSTLEDGGQDEQGMASTGYVGIRKSHKRGGNPGDASGDEARSSGGYSGPLVSEESCQARERTYDASETGRASLTDLDWFSRRGKSQKSTYSVQCVRVRRNL